MSKGYIMVCEKDSKESYFYYRTEDDARQDMKLYKQNGYKILNVYKCPARCTVWTKDGPEL